MFPTWNTPQWFSSKNKVLKATDIYSHKLIRCYKHAVPGKLHTFLNHANLAHATFTTIVIRTMAHSFFTYCRDQKFMGRECAGKYLFLRTQIIHSSENVSRYEGTMRGRVALSAGNNAKRLLSEVELQYTFFRGHASRNILIAIVHTTVNK